MKFISQIAIVFILTTIISPFTFAATETEGELLGQLGQIELRTQVLELKIAQIDAGSTLWNKRSLLEEWGILQSEALRIQGEIQKLTLAIKPGIKASIGSMCGGVIDLTYVTPEKGTILRYELNRNPFDANLPQSNWAYGVIETKTSIGELRKVDANLRPDTTYHYQLRAIGANGLDAYSEIVQAKSSVACPPPQVCTPPLTQNVTVACDLKNGAPATYGSVTRSQAKSAFSASPSCSFPALPVTNLNSKYESDTCVYAPIISSYVLTVTNAGNGSITSAPAGISCGTHCSASYPSGTSVTLTASPAGGYRFVTWSGACSNMTGNCVVAMSGVKNVTANFSLLPSSSLDNGGSSTTTINTTPAVVTSPGATAQPPATNTTTTPAANTTLPVATNPPATQPGVTTTPPVVLGTAPLVTNPPITTQSPIILTPSAATPPPATTANPPTAPITTTQNGNGLVPCDNSPSKPCDFNALMKLINNVIQFILFALAVPIAAISFFFAGFKMVTSGGSTEARGQAKKIFTNAVIGLVLAAGAWLIVRTILSILGFNGTWIGF